MKHLFIIIILFFSNKLIAQSSIDFNHIEQLVKSISLDSVYVVKGDKVTYSNDGNLFRDYTIELIGLKEFENYLNQMSQLDMLVVLEKMLCSAEIKSNLLANVLLMKFFMYKYRDYVESSKAYYWKDELPSNIKEYWIEKIENIKSQNGR